MPLIGGWAGCACRTALWTRKDNFVDHKSNFTVAVSGLLKQLNMDIPAETLLADKAYTISTGEADVELTGSEDGSITLFCFPGQLPKIHLESLATLLLANRYQHAYPPILTSLVTGTAPPKILLWSRLGPTEAGPKDPVLMELFVRMVEAADDMQSWINGGLRSEPGKEPKSAHIEWLKSQARPARIR
jgi:hypothetical protein